MNGLFTETGINPEVLQSHLGDEFYNDPETKQQPTKAFENIPDEATLVRNYIQAQRKISKGEAAFAEKTKGMIKIPGADAKPEEIAAYHKTIGVPDSPDKYELEIPQDPVDKAGFETIANIVKAEAHKADIPTKSLSTVWKEVVAAIQAQNKAIEEKGQQILQAEQNEMKEQLKEKYDSFIKTGDAVLAKLQNGPALLKLLETFGLKDKMEFRKTLIEIAPLVLQGPTVNGDGSAPEGNKWFTNYDYDTNGKPKT